AIMNGAVGEVVALLHGQSIHVGAKTDAAHRIAAAQGAHHAGLIAAAVHLATERDQPGGNEVRCAALLEAELRMGVDTATKAGKLRLQLYDAGGGGHWGSSDGRRV